MGIVGNYNRNIQRKIKNIKRTKIDPASTDDGTWYPQACEFLKEPHIHSSFEKSIIEGTIPYIKDRTKGFDDYFHCKKNNCELQHIKQWFALFIDKHN
jgi:putative transposase